MLIDRMNGIQESQCEKSFSSLTVPEEDERNERLK